MIVFKTSRNTDQKENYRRCLELPENVKGESLVRLSTDLMLKSLSKLQVALVRPLLPPSGGYESFNLLYSLSLWCAPGCSTTCQSFSEPSSNAGNSLSWKPLPGFLYTFLPSHIPWNRDLETEIKSHCLKKSAVPAVALVRSDKKPCCKLSQVRMEHCQLSW